MPTSLDDFLIDDEVKYDDISEIGVFEEILFAKEPMTLCTYHDEVYEYEARRVYIQSVTMQCCFVLWLSCVPRAERRAMALVE